MAVEIFISWSGDKSRCVAEALHGWLQHVIQAVRPWMSSKDIDRGSQWLPALSARLESSRVGIICLTRENLNSPWLIFEAGAMGKALESRYVCPYLHGVALSDLPTPLAQFQATQSTRDETFALVETINKTLEGDEARTELQLRRDFDVWWPDLEKGLENCVTTETEPEPTKDDREVLEEILQHVRHLRYAPAASKTPRTGFWPSHEADDKEVFDFFDLALIPEARGQALKSLPHYHSAEGSKWVVEETWRKAEQAAEAAGFGTKFAEWRAKRRVPG